jgi:hypothetical protein
MDRSMMDEKSTRMRAMLEKLRTAPPPPGFRYIQPEEITGDPIQVHEQAGMLRVIPRRCLCCGGIGINHDQQ